MRRLRMLLLILLISVVNCSIVCKFEYEHLNTLRCFPHNSQSVKLTSVDFKSKDANLVFFVDLKGCSIKSVVQRPFQDLDNITRLDLSQNNIEFIDDGVFVDTPRLEVLKLSNNLIKRLSTVIFVPLTELHNLDLSRNLLDIDKNVYSKIIQLPKLKSINLSTNIKIQTRSVSSNVETLSLIDVGLKDIRDIQGIPNLRFLLLSKNQIDTLPDNVFKNLTQLLKLDLSQNELTDASFPEDIFVQNFELENLNMSRNKIGTLDKHHLFKSNTNLKILDLSHNEISLFSENLFKFNKKLFYLDLSHNDLDYIDHKSFKSLENLSIINLSSNRFFQLHKEVFNRNFNLHMLVLKQNYLTNLPSGIFDENIELRTLNLAQNRISNFHYKLIEKLEYLTSLDLSNNLIDSLHPKFSDKEMLTDLNLSCNRIHVISSELFTKGNNALLMRLHGNPLVCSCLIKIMDDSNTNVAYSKSGFTDGLHPTCIQINTTSCDHVVVDPELMKEWEDMLSHSSTLCRFE